MMELKLKGTDTPAATNAEDRETLKPLPFSKDSV